MESHNIVNKKRPNWVWVISILYLISAIFSMVSSYFVFSGSIPITAKQNEYFNNLTFFDYSISIGISILNLSAAILLFFLRKQSLYLFTSAFALGLLVSLWQAIFKGWLSALGVSGFISVLIGWGISASVCVYVWHLKQRGTLS